MARDERSSRRSERDGEERTAKRGETRRGSGFRYQSRTTEQTSKRASQGGGDFDRFIRDDVKMFKPSDGDNTIRILPPTWADADHFGFDVWVHYGIGPDSQSYLCLHKMKGESCPICDARQKAADEGDDEYADKLKPTKRVLVALIDRDKEKEGVQVWSMPWTIDRDICKLVIDKKTGETLPIDDPEKGYDIEFSKEGKADRTKYIGLSVARRESDLGNDKWLDYITENPLPDVLQFYEYDHIEKSFGGQSSNKSKSRSRDKDDGDEKEDKKSSSNDRSSNRRESSKKEEKEKDDELTWDQVHDMTFEELSSLVDDEKLNVDPDDVSSDEEIADIICEELEISKPRKKIGDEEKEDDSPKGRLDKMRRNRER